MNIARDAETLVQEAYFPERNDIKAVGRFDSVEGKIKVHCFSLLDPTVDKFYLVDVVTRKIEESTKC